MSRRRAASAALPALREERAHLGNHGEGPGKLGGCRRKSSCEVIQARAPALPAQASGLLASDGGAPAPRRPAARTTSWGEASKGGRSPPPSFLGERQGEDRPTATVALHRQTGADRLRRDLAERQADPAVHADPRVP